MKAKKWEIFHKQKSSKGNALSLERIIHILLENRGLKTQKDIDEFLHGDLSSVTIKTVGIDTKQLVKAIKRIAKAIEKKEQIAVYGDYDVDGITGTAILWETLHALGAMVVPYIPHRVDEGYGLSVAGISNLKSQVSNLSLIITVDNGIVANEAVTFAHEQGIEVIVTDHHTVGKKLPDAHAIVHTTALCGAGVGYLLSQELIGKIGANNKIPKDHLSLVALATVADLVPLTGANRVLLRYGLNELHKTTRPGFLALFKAADIEKEQVGVYEIGHIIGPRLNAMGRLESAMDSLRLLCTKDKLRAMVLADTLNRTNKERQQLTQSAAMHAIQQFRVLNPDVNGKKLLFIAHEKYEEGIIGLVAGKLVEEYYLPAIVLSKGKITSKASARSIAGFNIIEFIRSSSDLLINAGGHPMAAGFTIETSKIALLQEALEKLAVKMVDGEMLQRVLRVDCEIPLHMVSDEFYQKLQELSPFGMGNPEPTFVSSAVIEEVKMVGKEKQHLKLRVKDGDMFFEAIAFGLGDKEKEMKKRDKIDMVYIISENIWNGRKSLQLKIRDIKK